MPRLAITTVILALALGAGAARAQTPGRAGERLQVASGFARTVSPSSLTIERDHRTMTFAVERTTRILSRGMASDLVLRNPQMTLPKAAKPGDQVIVAYRVVGRTRSAVEIRVRPLTATVF